MLKIEGSLNGKVYQQDIIPARDLISELSKVMPEAKLEEKFKSKRMRFDVADVRKKKKKNYTASPERTEILCAVDVNIKGEFFKLTYYEREVVKQGPNGPIKNLIPPVVAMEGQSVSFDTNKNLEKAVLFYFSKQNSSSPLRSNGDRIFITFYDYEEIARMRRTTVTSYVDLVKRVMSMSEDEVKMICYSFSIPVNNEALDTLKAQIIDKMTEAKSNNRFESFEKKLLSPETKQLGILYQAISKNIIRKDVQNGRHVYIWGHEATIHGEICSIPQGTKDLDALSNHVKRHYDTILPQIKKDLLKHTGQADYEKSLESTAEVVLGNAPKEEVKKEVPVKEMTNEELVLLGIKVGSVFRELNGGVFIIKGTKNPQKDVQLLSKSTAEKWIEETALHLDENADHRKNLINKIEYKKNQTFKPKA